MSRKKPKKPPEDPPKKDECQPKAESPPEQPKQTETLPTNGSGAPIKEKLLIIRNAGDLNELSEQGESNQYFKLLMNSVEIMERAAQVGRRRAVLFTLTEEDYQKPYMPFALPSYKPQKEWLVGAVKTLSTFLEVRLHLIIRIEKLRLVNGPGYRYCLVVYWPKKSDCK